MPNFTPNTPNFTPNYNPVFSYLKDAAKIIAKRPWRQECLFHKVAAKASLKPATNMTKANQG